VNQIWESYGVLYEKDRNCVPDQIIQSLVCITVQFSQLLLCICLGIDFIQSCREAMYVSHGIGATSGTSNG
jgi:hypothetical protein